MKNYLYLQEERGEPRDQVGQAMAADVPLAAAESLPHCLAGLALTASPQLRRKVGRLHALLWGQLQTTDKPKVPHL